VVRVVIVIASREQAMSITTRTTPRRLGRGQIIAKWAKPIRARFTWPKAQMNGPYRSIRKN
jgi:hypothetical protein